MIMDNKEARVMKLIRASLFNTYIHFISTITKRLGISIPPRAGKIKEFI